MKKAFILAAVIIVGLAIWYSFREPVKAPAATEEKAKSPKALKNDPIPRTELEIAKVAGDAQTPQSCTAQWDRTATVSLTQLHEDLKRGVLKLDPQCLSFEPQSDLIKKVYADCAYDASAGKLANESECLANFGIYRSLNIDRLTPDQKDYRSMSSALLANKILARFAAGLLNAQVREEVKAMVNAMIEREPGSFEAHKALVAIEMGDLETPGHSPQAMRAAIDGALHLNPNDSQMTEAYLFNEQMAGNPAAANEFVEHNPDSGLGYYYRAWGEWKAGDKENALADLQQAAKLLPGDERIGKTLQSAESGKNVDIFSVTVGFTFNDL